MSRRQFLGAGCAACAGAVGVLGTTSWLRAAEKTRRPRIRIVHALHAEQQPGPDWPNKGFDFRPVMSRVQTELEKRCPGIEFATAMATGPDQAKKLLEDDRHAGIDGYLVYQMNCWNQVVQTLATSGKPVLYADFQFGGSGGFLTYTAAFLRKQTPNVGFVASSRMADLAAAVRCFAEVGGDPAGFAAMTAAVRRERTPKARRLRVKKDEVKTLAIDECVRRMRASKILAVRGAGSGLASEIMGIPIVHVPFAEVNDAWRAADADEARALADRWEKTAKVIE